MADTALPGRRLSELEYTQNPTGADVYGVKGGQPVRLLVGGSGGLMALDEHGHVTPEQMPDSATAFDSPADALAAAVAVSGQVYWPAGDLEVAASIAGLHDVRHIGTGTISRGGQTFHPNPAHGQANTLFVSPSGDDGNDGITADAPFATLQAALNALANYGPTLQGAWTIQLAAGTYTEGALFPTGLTSRVPVTIQGPAKDHPDVPTAIIDGTASTYRRGIAGTNRLRVTLRDIKVVDFSGTDEAGIEFSQYCRVVLDNVHCNNNYYNWHFLDHCYYDAIGGILSAPVSANVQELFCVVRNFKPAGSLAGGTQMLGGVYGIKAKELCTGHLDFATIDGATHGVFLTRGCTANATDAKITNNTNGVVLRHGSFLVPLDIDWGIGTEDANGVNFQLDHSSGFVTNENTATAPFSAQGERQIGFSDGEAAHTGSTDAARLLDFGKLMAGAFDVAGRYLRAVVIGTKSGSAGTATLSLDVGGSNAANVVIPAAMTAFKAELYIVSRGQGSQRVWAVVTGAGADDAAGFGDRTYALQANALVGIDCLLANAADSITIDAAWLYTTGPVLADGL